MSNVVTLTRREKTAAEAHPASVVLTLRGRYGDVIPYICDPIADDDFSLADRFLAGFEVNGASPDSVVILTAYAEFVKATKRPKIAQHVLDAIERLSAKWVDPNAELRKELDQYGSRLGQVEVRQDRMEARQDLTEEAVASLTVKLAVSEAANAARFRELEAQRAADAAKYKEAMEQMEDDFARGIKEAEENATAEAVKIANAAASAAGPSRRSRPPAPKASKSATALQGVPAEFLPERTNLDFVVFYLNKNRDRVYMKDPQDAGRHCKRETLLFINDSGNFRRWNYNVFAKRCARKP